MAFDDIKDWTYGTVAEVKEGEKKIVLQTGEGALFSTPANGYYIVVWPAGQKPLIVPSIEAGKAAEAFRIGSGGLTSDTFTWTSRKQLGTSERTILVGDQVAAPLTAEQIKAIQEGTFSWKSEWSSGTIFAVGDGTMYKGKTWLSKKSANENHKPDAAVTPELASGTELASMEVEEAEFAKANFKQLKESGGETAVNNKGQVRSFGWGSKNTGGGAAGSAFYYSKENFATTAAGVGVRIKVNSNSQNNGAKLWLVLTERTNPETEKPTGYEVECLGRNEGKKYSFTIYKTVNGTRTELAKKENYDTGSTEAPFTVGLTVSSTGVIKVWVVRGGSTKVALEATDTTNKGPFYLGAHMPSQSSEEGWGFKKFNKTEVIEEIWWEAIATAPSPLANIPVQGQKLIQGSSEPEWVNPVIVGLPTAIAAYTSAKEEEESQATFITLLVTTKAEAAKAIVKLEVEGKLITYEWDALAAGAQKFQLTFLVKKLGKWKATKETAAETLEVSRQTLE